MTMVEFSAWDWPQWLFFGMMAFTLLTHCWFHGQERTYSAAIAVVDFAVIFVVLYAGGFWADHESVARELRMCTQLLDPNVSAVPIN